MNLIHSEHFKKYFDFEKHTWEAYFYGYEFDDRYYKGLQTTEKISLRNCLRKFHRNGRS